MKRKILVFLTMTVLIMSFCLSACAKYTSSFYTTSSFQTNTTKKASINFTYFKGTKVFELKSNANDSLGFTAHLEEGSAEVYYDNEGEKTFLFSVGSGEESNGIQQNLQKGSVYIIIESAEGCGPGNFDFFIENK